MRSVLAIGMLPCVLAMGAPAWAANDDVKVCVSVEMREPAKPSKDRARAKRARRSDENQAGKGDASVSKDASTPENAAPAGTDGVVPPTPLFAAGGEVSPKPSEASLALMRDNPSPEPEVAASDQPSQEEFARAMDPYGAKDPRVLSGAHLPVGQTPGVYLKRLMEHFVTHEDGFVAASEGCQQHIVVELYPLHVGWTAFARYSGTGREERVQQLLPTELSQFAERSVLALLHDLPIGETVDRDNVLWADSLKSTQRISGRGHFSLGLGTRVRGGLFDTVNEPDAGPSAATVSPKLRIVTPMTLSLGYRGQFDQYGVEALGELDLGTSMTAARKNPTGGHIDYGGSTALVLHVLRYANPKGLSSLYYGGGATFALHWFRAVRANEANYSDPRSTLWGGGLDVDALLGYEFMRASAVSFFLQGELTIPAYLVKSENNDGSIDTWFPGANLRLGANF